MSLRISGAVAICWMTVAAGEQHDHEHGLGIPRHKSQYDIGCVERTLNSHIESGSAYCCRSQRIRAQTVVCMKDPDPLPFHANVTHGQRRDESCIRLLDELRPIQAQNVRTANGHAFY